MSIVQKINNFIFPNKNVDYLKFNASFSHVGTIQYNMCRAQIRLIP